jgi:hypothetical protein
MAMKRSAAGPGEGLTKSIHAALPLKLSDNKLAVALSLSSSEYPIIATRGVRRSAAASSRQRERIGWEVLNPLFCDAGGTMNR